MELLQRFLVPREVPVVEMQLMGIYLMDELL